LSRISTLPRANTSEATSAVARSGQIVSATSTPPALTSSSGMELVPHVNKPIQEKKASAYAEVVKHLNSARECALPFKVSYRFPKLFPVYLQWIFIVSCFQLLLLSS